MVSDLHTACATMKKREAGWLSATSTGGMKSSFFSAVQHATLPYNLTGVRHDQWDSPDVVPSSMALDVVGDSISRELANALRALGANASYVVNTQTNLARDTIRFQQGYYHRSDTQRYTDANMSQVIRRLEECETDALFLGGYGTWRLRKPFRRWADRDIVQAPVPAHTSFISPEMVCALAVVSAHV
jgi:acid phosphatase family membrane protein YuiD